MPSRRAEHALAARALAAPLAILLFACVTAFAAFRFRHGQLCRELSARLTGLFAGVDWLVTLGGGLLLPVLFFAVVRYFTPLGGLDYSLKATALLLPPAQYLLLLLLIVSTPLLIIRHRLARQMAFFDGPPFRQRFVISLTAIGFVMLPLLGFSTHQFIGKAVMIVGALVIGMIALWLISLVIRALFGNPELALRRQTLARLMVPVLVGAMTLISATIPLYHIEERFWIRRDTLLCSDAAHPAMTRYEWEVTQQIKAELLEILAPLDEIPR